MTGANGSFVIRDSLWKVGVQSPRKGSRVSPVRKCIGRGHTGVRGPVSARWREMNGA